jgi:hypothetical protein
MINFRIKDPIELLSLLKAEGVAIIGEPVTGEYGKFGWIIDSEENKIEYGEPYEKNRERNHGSLLRYKQLSIFSFICVLLPFYKSF